MAVEVSQQTASVHHTGRLMASVSSLAVTVHHSSKSTVASAGISMVVHHNDAHKPVLVASESLVVHHTDEHQPVPVVGLYAIVHRTLGFYVAVTPLEVEPEVGPTGVRVKVFGGPKMRQAYFNVLLNHAHFRTVNVDYTTVPSSAQPPVDYETTAGTLTFAPGEVSKIVVVPVREADADLPVSFRLLVTSPVNATIGDAEGIANI